VLGGDGDVVEDRRYSRLPIHGGTVSR
jgi:hypothetical protein